MSPFLLFGMMTALASGSGSGTTSGMPPISPDLEGAVAVACVKFGAGGAITDAFLSRSTGDPDRDKRLLEWIRRLRWPGADPGDAAREAWFPMPLAIGEGLKAPEAPQTCGPSPDTMM